MNQFKVGDTVVCVDAKKAPTTTLETGLEHNQTYKLRWVGMVSHYIDGDYLGVKLEGLDRGLDDHPEGGYGYDDLPFRASRFRPLVSPKAKRELEEVV